MGPLPKFFWFQLESLETKSLSGLVINMRSDGALQFDGILPGEYRLVGFRRPESIFVQAATYNGADVLDHPLHFDGTSSGRLQIHLSSKVAQLQGRVTDDKSKPVPDVSVVLVPDKQRHRADLYTRSITDENGKF